jgi:hypothetical protein
MPSKRTGRVREQVMVYLDGSERALLERVAERTGLARTEIFRRGLRKLAEEMLEGKEPGWSLAHLIETATDDVFPPDVAARHDHYLYGGGYERPGTGKRARSG